MNVFVGMALLAAATADVPQRPQFRTSAHIVNVFVTALNAETGRPIADLGRGEFVIQEDGVRQQIAHFERDDGGASIMLLLDSSLSTQPIIPFIQEAATQFVRSLRPSDEVQIVEFAERYQELSDFTSDRSELESAVKRMGRGHGTALYTTLYTAVRVLERRLSSDAERKRAIVVLTDGEDTSSNMTQDSILDAVRCSGIMVYVVYLERDKELISPSTKRLMESAQHFLGEITFDTGGRLLAVPAPFHVHAAYGTIAQELNAQYHLGYIPSRDPDDGKWRSISVMTSRGDVILRSRRGYIAMRRP